MRMANPPYWISACGRTCRLFADYDPGVREDYREIVVEDYYGIFGYARRARPSVIVDVGANVGMFSKLCSLFFPDAEIYAYEPNPEALRWLERNAQGSRIKVCPYAVTGCSGDVALNTNFESTCGAKVEPGGAVRVQGIAASRVAEGKLIDLLKMDCEGSEWVILKDPSLLARTQDFFLEYHLWDDHTLEELRAAVEKADHCISRIAPRKEYHANFGFLWSTHVR
jgi:FkbM family methyltransferase